jgi:predicted dehydrogenase
MTCDRNALTRRQFVQRAGQAAMATAAVSTMASKAYNQPASDRKMRIGVVGGGFGAVFYWHTHPNSVVHAVSDLDPSRRDHLMRRYRCARSYESLEKMLHDPEIEAIAIFTGAPDHARHAIQAMEAGKHVIVAVPAAQTLEDCQRLREVKERTGRYYMLAETSWYRAHTMAAADLYKEGAFGELFYSECEYYHPRTVESIMNFWVRDGQRTWRWGMPPMFYPTHSTGFIIPVTGERLTEVSCLGFSSPTLGVYRKRDNVYDNPFSAQAGLFKTDRGHMSRCNVFFVDGVAHGERAQWFGTELAYYMPGSGGQPFRIQGDKAPDWESVPNFWERLPEPLRHDSGHGGSHTFLTHEFISALIEDREPAIDIYESLALTAPGLVAHESSLKGGEQLKIPCFDREKKQNG